jgi:hypothetical protein
MERPRGGRATKGSLADTLLAGATRAILGVVALGSVMSCGVDGHRGSDGQSACELGTVENCSGCGKPCQSGMCGGGRCRELGQAFASDVPGVMLTFAGDGFIFEGDAQQMGRYSVSRGVDHLEGGRLSFRPAAYYDGFYYGTRDGRVFRGKDPRARGEEVARTPWVHERTLAVDRDGVYGVGAVLLKVQGNLQTELLTAFPHPEVKPRGLRVSVLVPGGDYGAVYAEDVAVGRNEVYLAQVDTCQAGVAFCPPEETRIGSHLAAVGKDGTNPRVVATGEWIAHLATDDQWLYYSDMNRVYCLLQGGGKAQEIIRGKGLVSALGVTSSELYVGFDSALPKEAHLSAHRSALYRIPKPVCPEGR